MRGKESSVKTSAHTYPIDLTIQYEYSQRSAHLTFASRSLFVAPGTIQRKKSVLYTRSCSHGWLLSQKRTCATTPRFVCSGTVFLAWIARPELSIWAVLLVLPFFFRV